VVGSKHNVSEGFNTTKLRPEEEEVGLGIAHSVAQSIVHEVTGDDNDNRTPSSLAAPYAPHDFDAGKMIPGQILIGGIHEHYVDLLPFVLPRECLVVVESRYQADRVATLQTRGKAREGQLVVVDKNDPPG
jgi:hypothetical protein